MVEIYDRINLRRQIETRAAMGHTALRIAQDLGCKVQYAERVCTAWRAAPKGNNLDSSCPKFADHKRHVREVMKAGGFCAFSEKALGGGGFAVCLPLIWPDKAS